jgi:plastocyanin
VKKLVSISVLALVGSLSLVACGSSNNSTSTTAATPTTNATPAAGGGGGGGASSTLNVEADPTALAYTQDSLSTKAGSVTVDFKNPSTLAHNVTIQDSNGQDVGNTDTISSSTASTTVNLKPGTYTFFCSVDGHEAAGMKGTLTVK